MPAALQTAVRVVPLVRTRALGAPLAYSVAAALPIGAVVDAPLGPRRVRGVVVAAGAGDDAPAQLKEAVDTGIRVPPELVDLALTVAGRYASPPARALELVLPPTATPRVILWASPGDAGAAPVRGARQQAVLAALADGPLPVAALREATGASAATVRALAKRGAIVVEGRPPQRAVTADAALQATPEQASAIRRVRAAVDARDPAPLLLHGVTGSGKTEVFLQAIAHCLELGRGAIVLVPEIALAPQTAARVAARFAGRVAMLHSALGPGERAAEYGRIARGEAHVVVGPRSAIFAPVHELGLVVVDEEHESSYKQDGDPRYDARALAVLRARAEGAACLVASATPRPESWHALERLTLPRRVGGSLPPVELVDLRRDGGYPLSRPLHDGLAEIVRGGGRAILLLNRRGEAPALHCRGCGRGFPCTACDVALTLHRGGLLVCHHCGASRRTPPQCPGCGAVDLARIGAGTERLEVLVAERFPELEVLRLDADVVARAGQLEATLERFAARDRTVLVGTQLVAKGHHFADVRLAACIDADLGLAVPDFRAEERAFALLVQLAGRAGREGSGGRVLIQTWEPEGRAVRLAARHAVDEFLDGELARREVLGYPPFRRLVRVLVTAAAPGDAERVLARLAAAAAPELPGEDLLGPAPLFRLRGRDRAHLLVKTASPRRVARVLDALIAAGAAERRRLDATIVVDVDPQAL